MKLVVLSAACGVGKTTIKDELAKILKGFACIDADEVGINVWDYVGRNSEHSEDCLKEAVRLANGKDLLFSSCMFPLDFYGKINIPAEVTSTFLIAMTCSDEEITERLKARPAERMCGDDEFIKGQIGYNDWFRRNKGKFQLYIDNTGLTVAATAERIANFIADLPE